MIRINIIQIKKIYNQIKKIQNLEVYLFKYNQNKKVWLEYQRKLIIKNSILIDFKNLKINIIKNNQIHQNFIIIPDNKLIKINNKNHPKIDVYKHVAKSCEIN
jgi:hypothetical protein